MSEIRRVKSDNDLSDIDLSGTISGENGRISSVRVKNPYHIEGIYKGYPYQGQRILEGSFTYHQANPFNPDRTTEVNVAFMFREGSRLFILNPDQSDKADEILREVNSRLPRSSLAQSGFVGSRADVWDFIEQAALKGRIRVFDDDEIIDKDRLDLTKEELRQKIVWDAELHFQDPETKEQILTIYDGESIEINVDSLKDAEFIIQLLEQYLLS